MTQIFLVRHGEAEGNIYRRAQGQNDTNLTPRGRRQVEALASRFAGIPLAAAFSSDLRRARETALAALGGRDMPVTPDPRLREMCFGEWEDRPWGQIDWEEMDNKIAFLTDPARWYVPGGERYDAVQDRMLSALTDIALRHEGGAVLAASHGMAIRLLLARLRGIPSERISEVRLPDNASVTLLRWEDGGFGIEYENDVSHLPEKPFTPYRPLDPAQAAGSWDLRFAPFDTSPEGRERFLACYRDAWRLAHGSLRGFDAKACWRAALARAADDSDSLAAALRGDDFAGLLALDPRRGAAHGYGWIAFVYVAPEMRGHGCGYQLLGEAVSRCRKLGRRALRLTVAPGNPALAFYEKAGFVRVDTEPGALEPLLVMEMTI